MYTKGSMQIEEEIKEEESSEEPEGEEMPKSKRPKATGLMFTIFGALVVVLIGGLAAYYYYTFQRQGFVGEKAIRESWNETVTLSSGLVNKLDDVDTWDQLDEGGDDSFASLLGETNRAVRNALFDVRSQTGLDLKTSTLVSKLTQFLEDYGVMLAESKKVVDRVDGLDDANIFATAIKAAEDANQSYSELMRVGSNITRTSFPKEALDIPSDLKTLLEKFIKDGGNTEEKDKTTKDTAAAVVTAFVGAWQDRNATKMKTYLTAGAKGEFSDAIVEDSSEIVGFKIGESSLNEDKTKLTLSGDLSKETPDGTKKTEKWSFVLFLQSDKWLIDSWKSVS